MKMTKNIITALTLLAGMASAGQVLAANVNVIGNITSSTTWTSDNVYRLVGHVYVTNGATLTIQPGTVIKSNNLAADNVTAGTPGTLIVCRDGLINAVGTANNPIVFTSTSDTGAYRISTAEWGNVTMMGNALIGAYKDNAAGHPALTYQDGSSASVVTNTAQPTGLNKATMEGLTAEFVGDPKVLYGGNNDDDNRGTFAYVSLRFGGYTLIVNKELNGLSLGGIGRGTDIHHVDIWCTLDDGIEIWGGTVNIKYPSIWYEGDDAFDTDQGWRGKAQFGLIVQGYGKASGGSSGSGISDNMFEMDGPEASDAQPQSTATIYNFTAIGQPPFQVPLKNGSTDATQWRDNARIQYRNCIFMDVGRDLVLTRNSEGTTTDWEYGYNGTLTYANTWTTDHTYSFDPATTVNKLAGDTIAALMTRYQAQSAGDGHIGQGKLAEITDSVFYHNIWTSTSGGSHTAYNNIDGQDGGTTGPVAGTINGADSVGVTVSGGSNPAKGNVVASVSPIAAGPTRLAPVNVTSSISMGLIDAGGLDPRAANDALTSIAQAPADGFFTPAKFRGAFSSTVNWAKGWTAADAYGRFTGPANPTDPSGVTVYLAPGASFQTVAGQTYVIEGSTNGAKWAPLGTIVGDGTLKSFVDASVGAGNTAKLLRVTVQ